MIPKEIVLPFWEIFIVVISLGVSIGLIAGMLIAADWRIDIVKEIMDRRSEESRSITRGVAND